MEEKFKIVLFRDDAQPWDDGVIVQCIAANENFGFVFCNTIQEAEEALDKDFQIISFAGKIAELTPTFISFAKKFQSLVGPFQEFQAIIKNDPSPELMNQLFEFGIENFLVEETWNVDVLEMVKKIQEMLSDASSPIFKAIHLAQSVRKDDKNEIMKYQKELQEASTYDFRAAYASGKAAEVSGDYEAAIQSFKNSRGINRLFRPSAQSLGENLIITGKVDEAIEVFNELEKTNSQNLDRKKQLVSAYIEKGDFDKANEFASAIEKMSPESNEALESKALLLLTSGKLQEAFDMMDKLTNIGPFFASKLNEMGIKLSQSGKGKSALALYNKAHKIVRRELKYKISMNAGLACYKLNDFDLALKYLVRCEKEFGTMFPKLEKIILAVKSAKSKSGQQVKPDDQATKADPNKKAS